VNHPSVHVVGTVSTALVITTAGGSTFSHVSGLHHLYISPSNIPCQHI